MPPIFKEIAEKQLEESPWNLCQVPFVQPGGYSFRMRENTKVYDPSKGEEPIPGYTKPRSIFYQEPFSADPTYGNVRVEKIPISPQHRYVPINHQYLNKVNAHLKEWNLKEATMKSNPRLNEFNLNTRPLRKQLPLKVYPQLNKDDYSHDIAPEITPLTTPIPHHNDVYQKPVKDDLRLNESFTQNNFHYSERLRKREEARKKYQERKRKELANLKLLYKNA